MKNRIIRWGIIGSGGIARRRTIPEGFMKSDVSKLVAIYDIDSNVNNLVGQTFNLKTVNSIDELLLQDIDAVYIASPVYLHYEHAVACALAKKNVLCEKPLGLTVTEIEQMINSFEQHAVVLGTAFMMRFSCQHKAALKLIEEGRIGKPVFARAQLSCWYPPIEGAWRQDPKTGGGGSLVDMGSHCIDLLEMFFGNIDTVSCFIGNNIHGYQSEDSALVSLRFKNGAFGSVDSFFCIPDVSSKNTLELYGSKGSILAYGTLGQVASGEMTSYLQYNEVGYESSQKRDDVFGELISPSPINTYMTEIDEFSNALLDNRRPVCSADLGLRSQRILNACYQSAKYGKIISIPN